tara:strand:- start:491 stop:1138 length:648 start_codon:yes stop_codon:yes gene_type:complete
MALSKLAANSFDLTDNYALTGTVTGVVSTQKLFLIKNIDASSSGTVDFKDGTSSVVLDNTYKTYLFRWITIHPATDGARLQFQGNASGGSGFNETVTNTFFNVYHRENNEADPTIVYRTNLDQAQSTDFMNLNQNTDNDADSHTSGELWLFNPSSTTFVKHFFSKGVTPSNYSPPYMDNDFTAGYFNTTSAIDEIQFKFNTGNIDSGRIALYGIK